MVELVKSVEDFDPYGAAALIDEHYKGKAPHYHALVEDDDPGETILAVHAHASGLDELALTLGAAWESNDRHTGAQDFGLRPGYLMREVGPCVLTD